jgi:hypothetical protein
MAAAWNLYQYLAFGFIMITNEQLKPEVWNLIRRQVISTPTNSVQNNAYKSTITNTATLQNFQVMSNKFNTDKINTYVMSSFQKESTTNNNTNVRNKIKLDSTSI